MTWHPRRVGIGRVGMGLMNNGSLNSLVDQRMDRKWAPVGCGRVTRLEKMAQDLAASARGLC